MKIIKKLVYAILTLSFLGMLSSLVIAQDLQSDGFDGQELQPFWHVQNGDKGSHTLIDGKLVVQGAYNQNIFREDTSTRFYQVTYQERFSVQTSLIFDHKDICSVAGLIIKSPSQNEWVSMKLWGHGTNHAWVRNKNTLYLQFQQRGREIVEFVPSFNPPAGNVPVSLRLDRDGDNYTAWFKPDPQGEWIHVGDTSIELEDQVEVGIYTGICQTEAPGHLTVSFDNFLINQPLYLKEDINRDGKVNILDLVLVSRNFSATGENVADINGDGNVNVLDLVLVAQAFGKTA